MKIEYKHPWEHPRYQYTYRRKEDGHIYEMIWHLSSIINKSDGFLNMALNDLWECIGVERVYPSSELYHVDWYYK